MSVDSCCPVLLIFCQCVVLSTSCCVSEMAVGESILSVSCHEPAVCSCVVINPSAASVLLNL